MATPSSQPPSWASRTTGSRVMTTATGRVTSGRTTTGRTVTGHLGPAEHLRPQRDQPRPRAVDVEDHGAPTGARCTDNVPAAVSVTDARPASSATAETSTPSPVRRYRVPGSSAVKPSSTGLVALDDQAQVEAAPVARPGRDDQHRRPRRLGQDRSRRRLVAAQQQVGRRHRRGPAEQEVDADGLDAGVQRAFRPALPRHARAGHAPQRGLGQLLVADHAGTGHEAGPLRDGGDDERVALGLRGQVEVEHAVADQPSQCGDLGAALAQRQERASLGQVGGDVDEAVRADEEVLAARHLAGVEGQPGGLRPDVRAGCRRA